MKYYRRNILKNLNDKVKYRRGDKFTNLNDQMKYRRENKWLILIMKGNMEKVNYLPY